MINSDDKGLTEAVKNGDQAAFAALVHQYQKPIYNVVYRMLNDREEARDVTQTVFLRAFEKIDSYDPQRRFFSWICRIAVNEAINTQSRRKPETVLDEQRASGNTGPGEEMQQEDLHRGLEAALMKLTSEYRSVVVLKHISGMSYQDISATLEVSEKTVKSRLFTARQKLRENLKRDAYL